MELGRDSGLRVGSIPEPDMVHPGGFLGKPVSLPPTKTYSIECAAYLSKPPANRLLPASPVSLPLNLT